FWQQVKSKTEAEIQTKGFKRTFGFRPAIMKWAKGQKHIQTMQYLFLPSVVCGRFFVLKVINP
ncbi:MAG: hypothetical protein IJ588_09105, partial [Prevotella sp.]|nr:hypothetical protein [Prevotella sp.]